MKITFSIPNRILTGKALLTLIIFVIGLILATILLYKNFSLCLNNPETPKPSFCFLKTNRPVVQPVNPQKDKTAGELPKLLAVMEQFRNTSFKVIFDGIEYDIDLAVKKTKQLIRKHFRSGKAEIWVKNYLYRSPAKREIIYLKYPDGDLRPLRDVIIERLHRFST